MLRMSGLQDELCYGYRKRAYAMRKITRTVSNLIRKFEDYCCKFTPKFKYEDLHSCSFHDPSIYGSVTG